MSEPKQVVKNLELHPKLERSVESQYNTETLAIVPGMLLEILNRVVQSRSFTISGAMAAMRVTSEDLRILRTEEA